MPPSIYPVTRTGPAVEERNGLRVPDPYRWLEDDAPEVSAWQQEQTDLARAHVAASPHLPRFQEHVTGCYVGREPALPRFAAGRWFRIDTPIGTGSQRVVFARTPFGMGDVLVDVATKFPGNNAAYISWISPSPDARTLAVGVCLDGSEHNSMLLLDCVSRTWLAAPEQTLFDSWAGGAVWLPDSTGFYFVALASGDRLRQEVYFHRLGSPPPAEPEKGVQPEEAEPDYLVVSVARDGRWAAVSRHLTTPTPIAIKDLRDPEAPWTPFVTDLAASLAGHTVEDQFIAVTDMGAPRGRLVAVPLDADDPNNPDTWRELVAESDAVLRSVQPIGDALYLHEMVDTYSRVRVVTRDGRPLGEVPLPGRGAVFEPHFPLMALVPRGHPDEFVFGHSSLISSWGVYCHLPTAESVTTLRTPDVALGSVDVEDRWAVSADGTRVPYHVVRPADAAGPAPTLIWGYGGFNIPLVPQFPGAMAAFVLAGGSFVHAHLRGGAEFGRDWWEDGRGQRKQHTFDDLYAIAEDLIARGDTTPEQLALTGGSNGGLLCGVAVTQRPDLWRAVVPQVPILDLMGALRNPYGLATVREYADVDDVADLERLLTFSPYHAVVDGTSYPAVFVVAGNSDPRCPPWHARKWIARLQQAQRGDRPVLLRVWDDVGHGLATPADTVRAQSAEWLTFLADQVGLVLPANEGRKS